MDPVAQVLIVWLLLTCVYLTIEVNHLRHRVEKIERDTAYMHRERTRQ